MSRTIAPRRLGGHAYRNSHERWRRYAKTNGNRRVRSEVARRLKDVLFTDAFDEKEFEGSKRGHIFDRYWYD